jgi:hypothetical protein
MGFRVLESTAKRRSQSKFKKLEQLNTEGETSVVPGSNISKRKIRAQPAVRRFGRLEARAN